MTDKFSDYYLNSATNQYELKSNPSPLREERTEPKVGSPAHRKKFPERYGTRYTSSLEQAAYPKPGTAPSEKGEVSDFGPVKYDKHGLPTKASPKQMGDAMYRLEESRQMTGEPDKPKSKKTNPYTNIKIKIPTIKFPPPRDPKEELRKATLEKMRVFAFTPRRDPDMDRGVMSLKNNVAKKLKASESKSDWEKTNKTIYKG